MRNGHPQDTLQNTLLIVPGDRSIGVDKLCFNFPNSLVARSIIKQKKTFERRRFLQKIKHFFSAIWVMNNI